LVEEEVLKSLNELNKTNKTGDDDGEWEYSIDAMAKKLKSQDENKRKLFEEE